jgi:type III secretion protein R
MTQNLDPYSLIVFLAFLSLAPFLLVIMTSFLKIAVVLMIVRNAMGIQQVPPNMVIYGIALAITIFIMAPTIHAVNERTKELDLHKDTIQGMSSNLDYAAKPLKDFMLKQVNPDTQIMFMETARQLWPEEIYQGTQKESYLILIPSFVISELQKGLQIGFLIYLPFIIIDLLISNILLALGMQMVSPTTISLPLKILLFVLVEGWGKLLQSLALSYS